MIDLAFVQGFRSLLEGYTAGTFGRMNENSLVRFLKIYFFYP